MPIWAKAGRPCCPVCIFGPGRAAKGWVLSFWVWLQECNGERRELWVRTAWDQGATCRDMEQSTGKGMGILPTLKMGWGGAFRMQRPANGWPSLDLSTLGRASNKQETGRKRQFSSPSDLRNLSQSVLGIAFLWDLWGVIYLMLL